MGVLQDAVQWVQNIYQLETTDKVLGGLLPTGISNRQAQELANRTAFLLDLCEKLQDQLDTVHPVGEIQELTLAAYNASDYDQDPLSPTYGLGKVGTPAEHWALCNGINNTVDKRGTFTVGLDPASLDYAQPGQTGGANSIYLAEGQLPPHSHGIPRYKQPIQYDRGSTGGSPDWGAGTVNSNSGTTGSGQPIDIRPKFVTSIFRQRISN